MNERTSIITQQALSLPRDEQEAFYRALAESLGKTDAVIDEAWLDEAEDRLAAYDRGEIASVTLEEMIEPAYDRGEIPSVTLDEMIAARKRP